MPRTRRTGRKIRGRSLGPHPERLDFVSRYVRLCDLIETLEVDVAGSKVFTQRERDRVVHAVDQALFHLVNSRPRLRDF
jgi:hypothetical protein